MSEFATFLLPVVPLLVLLAFLLCGRYPGCEAIVRFSERLARLRRPRGSGAVQRQLLRSRSFAPSGGLLLALSLSGRAPPA